MGLHLSGYNITNAFIRARPPAELGKVRVLVPAMCYDDADRAASRNDGSTGARVFVAGANAYCEVGKALVVHTIKCTH